MHKIFAIISFAFLIIVSISGVMLGIKPLYYDWVYNVVALSNDKLNIVLHNLSQQNPDITSIYSITPKLWVATIDDVEYAIDMATGKIISTFQLNPVFEFFHTLHTRMFIDDVGRVFVLIASSSMVILSITGLQKLSRKKNGLRNSFKPTVTDNKPKKWHSTVGVIVAIPLLILGFTGSYTGIRTLIGFSYEKNTIGELFESNPQQPKKTYINMDYLKSIELSAVKEIYFPDPEDPYDVITIVTSNADNILLDGQSGEFLSRETFMIGGQINELMGFIHTTNNWWGWLLIWIISALMIPMFVVTGIIFLVKRPTLFAKKITPHKADIVILTGSEFGATEQYANALYNALNHALPNKVIAKTALDNIKPHLDKPSLKIIMTSTYGQGDAPCNAQKALAQINKFKAKINGEFCIVGFGDKRYAKFCGFAKQLAQALTNKSAQFSIDNVFIDNNIIALFQDWLNSLSNKIGAKIDLNINDIFSQTNIFTLQDKQTFTSQRGKNILLKLKPLNNKPFNSGDLIAIINNNILRYYSIANKDNQHIYISIRVLQNGLMSSYLDSLNIGANITGFVKDNKRFHIPKHIKNIIMIGTGTGVTPFVGMIAQNHSQNIYAYFGFSCAKQNPYDNTMQKYNIKSLQYAYSSTDNIRVNNLLKTDSTVINNLIATGDCAIMVCGTISMGQTVKFTLQNILSTENKLILHNNEYYLEDIY